MLGLQEHVIDSRASRGVSWQRVVVLSELWAATLLVQRCLCGRRGEAHNIWTWRHLVVEDWVLADSCTVLALLLTNLEQLRVIVLETVKLVVVGLVHDEFLWHCVAEASPITYVRCAVQVLACCDRIQLIVQRVLFSFAAGLVLWVHEGAAWGRTLITVYQSVRAKATHLMCLNLNFRENLRLSSGAFTETAMVLGRAYRATLAKHWGVIGRRIDVDGMHAFAAYSSWAPTVVLTKIVVGRDGWGTTRAPAHVMNAFRPIFLRLILPVSWIHDVLIVFFKIQVARSVWSHVGVNLNRIICLRSCPSSIVNEGSHRHCWLNKRLLTEPLLHNVWLHDHFLVLSRWWPTDLLPADGIEMRVGATI